MRKTAYSSYLKKQHYNVQKQQIEIETWNCRKFKLISKLNDKPKVATINDQKVENGLLK